MKFVFNNEGGTAMIQPAKPGWKKRWVRTLRIGWLHFYVSNCSLKKKQWRSIMQSGYTQDHVIENKRKLYERQGGRCPHCGEAFGYEQMELHHILPVSRYPELVGSVRNGIMLCHNCHKEVHCNPFRNIRMMQAKAEELGIDLAERYEK